MAFTETWLQTPTYFKLEGVHVAQSPPDPHQEVLLLLDGTFTSVQPINPQSWSPNTVMVKAKHRHMLTPHLHPGVLLETRRPIDTGGGA